jgi:hypothetical protein
VLNNNPNTFRIMIPERSLNLTERTLVPLPDEVSQRLEKRGGKHRKTKRLKKSKKHKKSKRHRK